MNNNEKNFFEKLCEQLENVKKSCEEFGGDLNEKAKEVIGKLLKEYNESEKQENAEFTSLEDEFAKIKENAKKQVDAAKERLKKMSEQIKKVGKSTFVFSTDDFSDMFKKSNSDCKKETKKQKTYSDRIFDMLPYLDNDSIHELVEKYINDEIDIDMSKALDYLDSKDIKLLLDKIIESGKESYKRLTIEDILPYASDKDITQLFRARVAQGIIDEELLDYVDDNCLHQIVVDYCNDENSQLDIDCIYPHLNSADLKLLFSTYLKRNK